MRAGERFRLDGQVVWVTGGGRGLGRQIARTLLELGAAVAISGRDGHAAQTAAQELAEATGGRAWGTAADVRDEAAVEAAVEAIERELGPVTALVNNAGTAWGAPAEATPQAAWDKVLATNATGAFLCSRAVGRRWIDRRRGGAIVNVASVAGLVGTPPEILDAVAYSASKGALIALTRDLAVKWARHGIRVNAVAPGFFPTRMSAAVLARAGEAIRARIPLGRLGGEDDLGGVVAFLLSPAAAYVTGVVVPVDGGLSAT